MVALFAAILLIGGIYAFYSSYLAPGMGPAPLKGPAHGGETGAIEPRLVPPLRPGRWFTSEMDGTWVKFYDADGERLYEAQMDEGDSFTVPADAEGPQVWTGRPYALAITVGGRSVPKLSEVDEVIKDVPITAEALLARADAAPRAPATPAPGEG